MTSERHHTATANQMNTKRSDEITSVSAIEEKSIQAQATRNREPKRYDNDRLEIFARTTTSIVSLSLSVSSISQSSRELEGKTK